MSYVVLARKYRPQTFAELTGQEHVSRTLQNAINSGRVAHAFLFTGARGVGKTSAARILAKALNCISGPAAEPCNSCHICQEITNCTSTDVLEIDGASNTGVDDVRELRDNSRYLPSQSRYKIYIIDEVHMLSNNAFNALLKILEEPPPHVKFIFATTEPHKLPITILSRCQRFDFKRIPIGKLVAQLRHIATKENIEISDAALAMIARKGDGSMRDALSCFDQVLAFCGNKVADEDVITLVGVVDRKLLADISAALFSGDTQEALQGIKRVGTYGYSIRQFTQELIGHFRNLLITGSVKKAGDILDLAEAEFAELSKQAATVKPDEIQRSLVLLMQAESNMAHSAFPRLLLEMVFIKISKLQPVLPIEELLEQIRQLEAGMPAVALQPDNRQKVTDTYVPDYHQPVVQETVKLQQVAEKTLSAPAAPKGEGWEGFVEYCRAQKPLLGGALEHGLPLKFGKELMEIGFPEGSFHLSSMRDKDNQQQLQQLAADFNGTAVKVIISAAEAARQQVTSLAETKEQKQQKKQDEIRSEILNHPVVTEAVRVFEGEIVEIKAL
ncbi:MAG: DNA polymerase III subunit gamma/tau [Trichlorobacter sp.]|nr:DNA polymerase III subunit gamma/tau [Trichlorobacter sp.]